MSTKGQAVRKPATNIDKRLCLHIRLPHLTFTCTLKESPPPQKKYIGFKATSMGQLEVQQRMRKMLDTVATLLTCTFRQRTLYPVLKFIENLKLKIIYSPDILDIELCYKQRPTLIWNIPGTSREKLPADSKQCGKRVN